MKTVDIEITGTTATMPKDFFLALLGEKERLHEELKDSEECLEEAVEFARDIADILDVEKDGDMLRSARSALLSVLSQNKLLRVAAEAPVERAKELECENRDYRNRLRQIHFLSQ